LYEEVYDTFESRLTQLPRRDVDLHLREAIIHFINSIK
jgi:hypothetical protein